MWCIANIDYHIWKKWAVPGYLLSILLGVLVMLFGEEYNGSKRWLSFGPFSFQPSEFAKVAVILFLTYIILRNAEKMWKFFNSLQDCYQCAANCRSGWGEQFEHSGYYSGNSSHPGICRKSEVWAICVDGVSGGVHFMGDIFLLWKVTGLNGCRSGSIRKKYEKGYQTLQGLYAIGSGGLFGRGLGSSIQKLGFVPEAQNDMIFSIICEELGLFGAVCLILVFVALIFRMLLIALNTEDLFGH